METAKESHLLTKAQSGVRYLLMGAIFGITWSCLLLLKNGQINVKAYGEFDEGVIYCAVILSVWTLLISVVVLLSLAISNLLTKKEIWHSIKKECLLFLALGILVTVFCLLFRYLIDHDL